MNSGVQRLLGEVLLRCGKDECTVELGIVYDVQTLEPALARLTTGLAVQTRIVEEDGPAGGWPLVEFKGTKHDLLQVIRRYDGCDADGCEGGNFSKATPDAEIWAFYHDGIG